MTEVPAQDVPDIEVQPAPDPHNILAAMHAQFSPIPTLLHLIDNHTESPTRWQRQITDLLPLLGPDWRHPDGTTSGEEGQDPPDPFNRLCASLIFLDSEKLSKIIRSWMELGFLDPVAGGGVDYDDVPLAEILEGIERIALKDKEASASTALLKSQRGLCDPSLSAYKCITEYCKAIEAVDRNMGNAFEIAQCITHCDPDGIPTGTDPTFGPGRDGQNKANSS